MSGSCVESLECQSSDNVAAEPCRYEDQRPCCKLLLGDPPHLPKYHFRAFVLISKLFVLFGISPQCWKACLLPKKKGESERWSFETNTLIPLWGYAAHVIYEYGFLFSEHFYIFFTVSYYWLMTSLKSALLRLCADNREQEKTWQCRCNIFTT